jgi:hypothetical protein
MRYRYRVAPGPRVEYRSAYAPGWEWVIAGPDADADPPAALRTALYCLASAAGVYIPADFWRGDDPEYRCDIVCVRTAE